MDRWDALLIEQLAPGTSSPSSDPVDRELPAEDDHGEDSARDHDLHHHINDDLPLDHAVKRTSDPAQA